MLIHFNLQLVNKKVDLAIETTTSFRNSVFQTKATLCKKRRIFFLKILCNRNNWHLIVFGANHID